MKTPTKITATIENESVRITMETTGDSLSRAVVETMEAIADAIENAGSDGLNPLREIWVGYQDARKARRQASESPS